MKCFVNNSVLLVGIVGLAIMTSGSFVSAKKKLASAKYEGDFEFVDEVSSGHS